MPLPQKDVDYRIGLRTITQWLGKVVLATPHLFRLAVKPVNTRRYYKTTANFVLSTRRWSYFAY